MPPLPQLRSPAIKDLYEQLRFAPPRALKRDIERAETLAGEVDHDTTYPEDWIVFRVTGFRPEIGQPRMTEGAGLLADLSSLVERLSHDARLSQDELDGDGFLDAATLCRRWGVSRKTIDRYRRQGLVARRVRTEQGRSVLMFASGVVETFERTHGRPISRAGDFTRIAPDELERIVEEWVASFDSVQQVEDLLGDKGGVQCGRVRTWKEMLEDPHVEQRKLVAQVDDPTLGQTPVMNSPFRLSGAHAGVSGPAPLLGQHTQEVLQGLLGYSNQEVMDLVNTNALHAEAKVMTNLVKNLMEK
ncbi:MAG: CoA transferase [Planctomycetes bacterium]|nr:CoA transferase [Planctomycetota bacterium]